MFGVEVAGEALAGIIGFVTILVTGIASWALILLVKTAQLLARLEERVDELTRRIADIERL